MSNNGKPTPKRPFRDSAILYAVFAVLFVVITFITGGNVLVSIPLAAACFVLATAYSWWRIRHRLDEERQDL